MYIQLHVYPGSQVCMWEAYREGEVGNGSGRMLKQRKGTLADGNHKMNYSKLLKRKNSQPNIQLWNITTFPMKPTFKMLISYKECNTCNHVEHTNYKIDLALSTHFKLCASPMSACPGIFKKIYCSSFMTYWQGPYYKEMYLFKLKFS